MAQTYEGIDGCGERLVEEIHGLMAQYPLLEEISILGHSMGGLIARYAMGRLYDAETGRIAGRLLPVHFIGMACPHLGCDTAPGPAQVSGRGIVARFLPCLARRVFSCKHSIAAGCHCDGLLQR